MTLSIGSLASSSSRRLNRATCSSSACALREEAGATNSLPALVSVCRHQIGADGEALTRFDAALAQTGYSHLYEEEYARLRLRALTEALYAVHDNFPRLTPEQLVAGLPGGIERIEYDVNLGGFDHLRIARTSAEAPAF